MDDVTDDSDAAKRSVVTRLLASNQDRFVIYETRKETINNNNFLKTPEL